MSGGRVARALSAALPGVALLGVALLGVALLGGCAPRTLEAGAMLDPARVAAIHPGQSTREDISRLFGAPAGQGRVMLPFQDHPHPAWTYQFARARRAADGQMRARRGSLLVFFEGETVAGYLWMESDGE